MWLPSHGVLYGLEVIKCTLVIGDSSYCNNLCYYDPSFP